MQYFEGTILITFSKGEQQLDPMQENVRTTKKKQEELLPHASEHLHIPVSAPNFLQSKRVKLVCVTKNPKNMLLCRYLLTTNQYVILMQHREFP